MPRSSAAVLTALPPRRTLLMRVGFVPLADCAPVAAAAHLGIFARHGLRVQAMRQPGWASIRDGLISGAMDAAHAPATLVFAAQENGTAGAFSTSFILNTQGNAITLARTLHERGIRDRSDLLTEARARRRTHPVTFAAVARFSMHMVLLRQWLSAGGIDPDKDVRVVTLPPRQMCACLAAGHIDGFCAGEPWNSLAVAEGSGWTAASSADLAPGHPEKALVVTRETAGNRTEEHAAMIRALHEAAVWCDTPDGRRALPALLTRREWLDMPQQVIAPAFSTPGFISFHKGGVNEPSADKAAWLLAALRRERLLKTPPARDSALLEAFDAAFWRAALKDS